MNLKESFRYQTYLNSLSDTVYNKFRERERCINTIKTHLKHKANPEDIDEEEIISNDKLDGYTNDNLLKFMEALISEKNTITEKINKAKHDIFVKDGFDIDALIEANKMRRSFSRTISLALMLNRPKEKKDTGTGYKFNLEGNQVPYSYEIEVKEESSFDRENAKNTMKTFNEISDGASVLIDMAMVNGVVDHTPIFDVNDSFEDAIISFINL